MMIAIIVSAALEKRLRSILRCDEFEVDVKHEHGISYNTDAQLHGVVNELGV